MTGGKGGAEPSTARSGARDLTIGAIGPTLFAFALPALGSTALQSLNASVNAVWVGRLLGETAIGATANANNVLFLLLAAVIGFGMASTILIGQAMGRKDPGAARRVVGSVTSFFIALAMAIGGAGYLLTPPLLRLMDTPPDVFPLAIDYMRVIFLAMPVLYLNVFLGMALRGAGDSRTPFRFMLLSVVLDIALNPVFILGLGPFPAIGIAGSAWATLVSQAVSVAAILLYLYARRFPLVLGRRDLGLLRPDPAIIRTVVGKGVPMGAQMLVVSLSGLTMISIANGYGVHTVAGYGIAMQLWSYAQMPCFAFGMAASAMAAQNVGAGRWDRVGQVAITGSVMATAATGLFILIIYLFERPLFGLFLPDDAAAVAVGERVNLYGLWGWLFFGAVMVLFAVVRATGAVLVPLAILAVALLVVRIPLAFALEPSLGADAIWLSSPISLLVTLVLTVWYYRRGSWRSARMGGTAGAGPGPGLTPSAAGQAETPAAAMGSHAH